MPKQKFSCINSKVLFVLLSLLWPMSSLASVIPDALKPWQSWILKQHPDHQCPWLNGKKNQHQCYWPSSLKFETRQGAFNNQKNRMDFSFEVEVFTEQQLIPLPGDKQSWPINLKLKQENLILIEQNGRPFVALPRGKHVIKGHFEWPEKPQQLTVPDNIALVSLQENGRKQSIDRRGEQLIFNRLKPHQKQSQDSVNIEVYRRLNDGIPLTLVSLIKVTVSGKPRELSFGRALPPNSKLLHLQTDVPSRLEANGNLRAQLSAGVHHIWLRSRFSSNPETISIEANSEFWPQYEYLSVASKPELRQLKLSGAPSIDTSQIDLPTQWRDLPTYRLTKEQPLKLETEYRGNHSPAVNQLYIKRTLWLDFNGKGLTSLDHIHGSMSQDWRLNANSDTQIGRASVDNEPVLITADKQQQGIEIRSADINLSAITRPQNIHEFSALGWQANAETLTSQLNLPPGWRVLHAQGVDQIYGSWISKWDLWDIFLLLIIIAAVHKLLGLPIAILAAVTFILTLHETNSPILYIPLLLIIAALLPISSGKFKTGLSLVTLAIGAGLLLSLIGFATQHFRLAIYPSLEHSAVAHSQSYSQHNFQTSAHVNDIEEMVEAEAVSEDYSSKLKEPAYQNRKLASSLSQTRSAAPVPQKNRYQIDENDRVQTGPGLPTWSWNTIQLNNTGPISAEQTISLIYSPPWMTAIWRVLAVFSCVLLSLLILKHLSQLLSFKSKEDSNTSVSSSALAGFGIGVVLSLSTALLSYSPQSYASKPDNSQMAFPPEFLLQQLKQQLLRSPQCLPDCASLNEARLKLKGKQLTFSTKVYANTDIALALPNGGDSWQLQSVHLNGQAANLIRKKHNNQLQTLALIPKGSHQLQLQATLNGSQAALHFPQAVHNLKLDTQDWLVEGLNKGYMNSRTLTLKSRQTVSQTHSRHLKPDPAPGFFTVRRSFSFGKQWQLQTDIIRHAPKQGALSLVLPLLEQEKPLADIGSIKQGKVSLQFVEGQNHIRWTSSLSPAKVIHLKAAETEDYVEEWRFLPSSLWRLQYQGLAPTNTSGQTSSLEPVFKPWPGETLSVNISRPEGIAGETYTLEKARLEFTAGKNIQRSTLYLSIRSSMGEDYRFSLPENASVLSMTLDDKPLNLPAGHRINIPLQPGLQELKLEFQQEQSMGMLSRTPRIQLPGSASNIDIDYKLPHDRWPLYIKGPAIGPAMLFWGVLCVIVLISLGLPLLARKTGLSIPLGMSAWLLLGIGLSTVNSYGALFIAAMFFLLAARQHYINPQHMSANWFNALQCFIVFWVLIASINLISAIPLGLLSSPEMKVVGNDSYSHLYRYYQDMVSSNDFPQVCVISVPILAYRIVMLLWSLWLATRLIHWASWGWACFKHNGLWRSQPKPVKNRANAASQTRPTKAGSANPATNKSNDTSKEPKVD